MNRLKHLLSYSGLTLLALAFWLGLWSVGLLDGLEQEAMRWRYLMRGERVSTAPIVYVDLDAEAISYIGDRPWDRRDFAALLHALLGAGEAKAVGVDMIFSKFGPGALLDQERARAGDEYLGEVVAAYPGQVVLAAAYTGTYSSIADETADLLLMRDGFDDPSVIPFPESPTYPILQWEVGRLGLANVDQSLNKGVVPYWVPAFVELAGSRYSLHLMDGAMRHKMHFMNGPEVVAEGDVFQLLDLDGWMTWAVPQYSEQRLFTLGIEMFLAGNGLGADSVERTADTLIIRKNEAVFRRVPLTQGQSVEANWFGRWMGAADSPHYSMKTVLVQADALGEAVADDDAEAVQKLEAWFERFTGKVIFVGPVDSTLKDVSPTPFDRSPTPKVALHANLYRTIQDEAFVMRVGAFRTAEVIVALTCLIAFLSVWSGVRRSVAFLVLVLYIALVFYGFTMRGVVLPLIAPVGSALTAALCVLVLKLGSEELERRRIKTLFGAYVSPEVVDELVTSQRDPELGGAEAEVSALFSDVEGFSAFSEILPPDQLVALMNEYLSAMTDALQVEGGTLDKYIGDAIVVMFGMPLPVEDHAARACLAALRMQERHNELRKKWATSGEWPELVTRMRTRIGVNTGVAVVGNMGSRVRFNYTMMGDSVNLAARCESGAKTYGVYTMVTAATLHAALLVVPGLRHRKLDRIVVKGRTEPVEVFELWGDTVDLVESNACRDLYESGLRLYFSGAWDAALVQFLQSEAFEPSRAFAATTPSAVLIARCREFVEAGPPDGWGGVYQMRTK